LKEWETRLTQIAREVDSSATVSGRVKSYRSMIGKAHKNPGRVRRWEEFGDLVALKVIFPTKPGVDNFTEMLLTKAEWAPSLDRKEGSAVELKYKSMQFDLSAPDITDSEGQPIKTEVQVRTAVSDAWYVVDHRLKYKGVVTLPDELTRKLARLIVLTELFDEEVEAVLAKQVELPEYLVARLYSTLIRLSEGLSEGRTHTSRPEGLLELLLTAYSESELANLDQTMKDFVERDRGSLSTIFSDHLFGSPNFVEERDWIYYEPEALLIAERSTRKPALLRSKTQYSDFQSIIGPMIDAFSPLKLRDN
jgi:ppGpp synthetase/RelA/SpoT-type nucleotidyltranferase